MPRIPASVQRLATHRDKLLVPLLTQCRDLNSAQNELRWLQEHAAKDESQFPVRNKGPREGPVGAVAPKDDEVKLSKLEALIKRRAAGEPLQYILGDQPFGDLEILCEPKVLIPRPETEAYTINLVKELLSSGLIGARVDGKFQRQRLRVLDLCTGTGAIALLLHHELRKLFYQEGVPATEQQITQQAPMSLEIVGIDVSPDAVSLARRNLEHNLRRGLLDQSAQDDVIFRQFDVTKLAQKDSDCKTELTNLIGLTDWTYGSRWDIIMCNPPYVAPNDYAVGGRTEESVRKHEPRLALVPPQDENSPLHPGDTFYPFILRIARKTGAGAIVMEVGDRAQAERVEKLVDEAKLNKRGQPLVQIWHDDGSVYTVGSRMESQPELSTTTEKASEESHKKKVAKAASARAVVVWRGKWAKQRAALLNPQIRRVEGKISPRILERERNRATRQLMAQMKRAQEAGPVTEGGKAAERGHAMQEAGR